ncbi:MULTISPECIES: hypothetical protein [Emticicia]|uniref:hypothetical protein n=1 Tax=Emticicia TaxID=312278 RepID=UPI000C78D381|nr:MULTISPECIES: hypothetical protein [Emticicia]PLK43051.1 hypothetical protein C0V77_16840 [Emticicia sp. TH156]UTA69083.1 hypothetical protein MB380_04595 [Emticicia sp. 21SJ11W-3]
MKRLLTLLIVGIFAISFDVSAQTTTTAAALDTVAAKSYVGKYKMKDAPFEEIIVTLKDGKLIGEAVGQGVADLAPTKEPDVFEVVGYDGKLEFVKNDSKIVTKIKLTIQGSTLEGDKQP